MNNQPEKAVNQQEGVPPSKEKKTDPFGPDQDNDATVLDPDKKITPLVHPEHKVPMITDPDNDISQKGESDGKLNSKPESDKSASEPKK